MKNIYKYYGILAVLLLIATSCHDELEKLPVSNLSQDNYYTNIEELGIGMVGVYDELAQSKDGYGEAFIKIATHGTHVATTFLGNVKQNTQAWYTFDNTEESFWRFWGSSYSLIYRANQVIDRSAQLIVAPDEQIVQNRIVAEARFLRASMYFNLVRFWGDVPLIKEELINVGNSSSPRVAAEEVYEFIIEDLKFAEENLYYASWVAGDRPSYGEADLGRATIGTAQGLLAKVYLTRASLNIDTSGLDNSYYQLAYDKAQEVMTDGHYQLEPNYGTLFTVAGERSHEWMFQIQFDFELLQPGIWGGVNGPKGNNKALDWTNLARSMATLELLNHYDDDDPRYQHNIAQGTLNADNSVKYNKNQNKSYVHKFRFTTKFNSAFNTDMNAPVMRYADIILVYAEAAAYLGLDTDAHDALDMIRDRARNSGIFDLNNVDFLASDGISPTAVDRSLTGEDLLDEIIWDRAKELCFEGTGKFDVFRYGETKFIELVANQLWDTDLTQDTNASNSPKPVPWGGNVQPKHILFPIPEAEIRGNSFINIGDNNEGW